LIPDYLILGGGIVGLATAWELAGRGASVEVLEKALPGQESSWAGAGILSTLLPWDYGAAVTALAERSQARYAAWIDRIRTTSGTDPEYRQTGMLVLPPFPHPQAEAWLAARGWSTPTAPPAPLAALPNAAEGIWLPQVAQVRNPRLIQALLGSLAARGITVHHHAAAGFEVKAGRLAACQAGGRRWQAHAFIAAAGAWTADLLAPCPHPLPIRPVRGQMLLYRAKAGRLPSIVYQQGRYLVPRADGHILAGSTLEEVGFDKATTPTAFDELHGFVGRLLPDVAASSPIRHWAGLRPGSPDNVPIISRHPDLANLFVNSGHFRYGVTMAPASAELLADLALGTQPALDPSPYAWPAPAVSAAAAS
jgi:glycine oxidase